MVAGASVGTGVEFEPGVGAAVGLGAMTGVVLAMDVVEGVEVDVATGTGSCVGGTKAVCVSAVSGCVHAASNTAAKARRTIQCDLVTMVSMLATPELRRKPRFELPADSPTD